MENATNRSIRTLKGVGEVRVRALEKMGLFTLEDLLRHYPRAYQNRGDVRLLASVPLGERHAFLLTVATEPKASLVKGRMTLVKLRAFDESGSVEIVFFNQPYVKDIFHVGMTFRFWGALTANGKRRQLSSPVYEEYTEQAQFPDYTPVYTTTEGISQKVLASLVDQAIRLSLPALPDPLPERIRERLGLPTLHYAIRTLHAPTDSEALSRALRRIVFDELFVLGLTVALSRSRGEHTLTDACKPTSMKPLTDRLPYELTGAQKRAINEIYSDMTGRGRAARCPAMRRILIGDVGCGKTVCAAAAILIALASGGQAALMVPTSILAHQHYADLAPLFSSMGYETALLTGATKASERKRILARLADPGDPLPLVIGTHALLSESVSFSRLTLTVTDEQHRFGVMQRAALKEKQGESHTLVMSATPIPRTLAHVLYGDLAVSRIDEMPHGRERVETFVVGDAYRERLNAFILRQVREGGQVYVVCPSIEERDDPDSDGATPLDQLSRQYTADTPPLKNAKDYAKELQAALGDVPVALLHGKMKQAEKDAVMADFVEGKAKVLVSTTVIEVGVNVPSATLMIVENADRFGLSQLHQLRGRVGRGSKKSYCVLVSDSRSESARARLEAMQTVYDGYEIAERDLALRGPGDFFSTVSGEARQAGGLSLRLAACCDDTALMEAAFSAAREVTEADPTLALDGNAELRRAVEHIFSVNLHTIS